MIVVHGSWRGSGFHLWGEMSPQAETAASRTSRAPTKGLKSYPFDAGRRGLRQAVRAVPDVGSIRGKAGAARAWLPTRGRDPIAGSPMIAPPPDSGKLRIAPWRVNTLTLDWVSARRLLGRCVDGALLGRGVVAAPDLRAWAQTLRLAAALTVRQSFLPGLRQCGNGFEARWLPVLDAGGREKLEALARTLPASARCLSEVESEEAPEDSPLKVAQGFLDWALDLMVRESAAAARQDDPSRRAGALGSVHDAWMSALRSNEPAVPWDDAGEVAALARSIEEWRRSISLISQSACRLCFRLEEPDSPSSSGNGPFQASDASWTVRYLLQPVADRSLLVPVSEFWKPRSRQATAFRKVAGDPHPYLLMALGQAAGLSPLVRSSLERKDPSGYALGTEEAHEFLTRQAPALEAAGFGVLLPRWWGGGGGRNLSVRAKATSPTMRSSSGLTLDALASVQWELALGDDKISVKDLHQLAKMKVHLVRIRGAWVELDPDQVQAAADFFKLRPTGRASVRDLVAMALGDDSKAPPLPLSGVEADGWIADLLAKLEGSGRFQRLDPPAGFTGALRPYQLRGYSWLAFLRRWGLGACLADDMGLGKTIQTLALILREREQGESRPALLVCPTSVVNNWRKEAERFTPGLSVLVHHGGARRKKETFVKAAADQALVVSSFGLLRRDREFLESVDWAGVILDEAQNIKNPETAQARAARSLRADYRIALTGTPVENHIGDLWSIMEFLNPGLLGTQASFKRRFFNPIQMRGNAEAGRRLKRLTGPFILRRLKTDRNIIADLPEKMEMKTYCTLTREQASLYAAVLEECERGLEESEGIQRKGLVLATLSKLKQVCNHPAQFLKDQSAIEGRSGKLARLAEMMEEVFDAGDRALVFTQFAEMGRILQRHLQEVFGREILYLHGGVSKKQRDRMVERFQQDGEAPALFILSLKAGGTGLNLTRANHVFHFDRWWNPAVENQATDRAFRIGQKKNVQIYKFVCAGTLEERIDAMIEAKKAVAEDVVQQGEAWLTELSNDELLQVFSLGREAVGD